MLFSGDCNIASARLHLVLMDFECFSLMGCAGHRVKLYLEQGCSSLWCSFASICMKRATKFIVTFQHRTRIYIVNQA